MTAAQLRTAVNEHWPHPHGAIMVDAFLLQADNLARAEVLGLPPRRALPEEEELSMPEPYTAAYIHFATALLAQMDGAYDRYNAEIALYTALYDSFACAYRRENLPPRGAQVQVYG